MTLNEKIEQAVLKGDLEFLMSVASEEVDWNFKVKYDRTILYDAVVKGYSDIVNFLCKKNSNVNFKDRAGKSPLHFAAIHRQLPIAKILIDHGADVNLKDDNGNNPLFDAIFNCQGETELVSLLIKNGADYLSENNHGVSPKELAETIANFDITHLFGNS